MKGLPLGEGETTVAVAVASIIATYGLARLDERRRQRRNTRATRAALLVEMDTNLRVLDTLWADINRPPVPQDRRVANPQILPAVRLALRDPPRWRRTVRDDHLPQILEALSPREVEQVDRFYRHLDQFDVHRGALGKPWLSLADNLNFHADGLRAWDEIQAVANVIRSEGNPLV